jgi:hypothetical protein
MIGARASERQDEGLRRVARSEGDSSALNAKHLKHVVLE